MTELFDLDLKSGVTDGEAAVTVTGVGKRFRLFTDRRTNLKELLVKRRRRTRYEEFWAVKDVSLTIPKGSTFGLVGHNGSGKSTLLKLIAGIHRPTNGTIVSTGRISALLELGAGFHPELSGRDNIYLNGAILGLSRKRIDSAIDEIIEFSGLGQFIDVPVKVYSSGMYVRLGFAIAVTLDPEILVIDEIIAVGDEEFQRRCFDYLHRLRKRGVTIIFVTHSMGLVQQLCDAAAWLEHGEIKAIGTANDVVQAYLETVNNAEEERIVEEQAEAGEPVTATGAHDRGTGEIVIDRLEFLDAEGQSRKSAVSNQPLTVRLHYTLQAGHPVTDVGFGLAFRHETGAAVSGTSTRSTGVDPITVSRNGFVDYRLDPAILNPGRFYLSASVVDPTSIDRIFDYWYDAGELQVNPGRGLQQSGMVRLPGTWVHP